VPTDMRKTSILPTAASLLLGLCAGVTAQTPDSDQVFRVSITLDQTVSEVTRNAYAWEFTPQRGQGVVIPGYGVVFVLSPRVLPSDDGSPVRNRVMRLRALPRVRVLREADAQALSAMEAQLAAHEKEREEADIALARAMAQLERVARLRLVNEDGKLPRVPAPPAAPGAPEAPAAPTPPAPETPATPVIAAPQVAPPMPPPWTAWFGDEDEADEYRDPKVVIAQIRTAVTGVLTTEAPQMAFLRGDDQVVVAINFVPDGLFTSSAQPTHTLVVRAKKKDLMDRASGRITAEELAKRSEATEY
jgi:hypothetical protein